MSDHTAAAAPAEAPAASVDEIVAPAGLARKIIADRFRTGTPRSAEYRLGAQAAVHRHLGLLDVIATPYAVGTAQCDAFFSGVDEGHRLASSAGWFRGTFIGSAMDPAS